MKQDAVALEIVHGGSEEYIKSATMLIQKI